MLGNALWDLSFDACFIPADVATGTDKGHITETTESIRTTPLTNHHSTAVTENTDVPTDTTAGPNTSRGFVTAEGNATSHTDSTQSRVTTITSPALSTSSNDQGTRTHFTAFSDQSPVSDVSTSHRGPESISTRGTRDETLPRTRQSEVKPLTSLEESDILGKITDRPGNTHATTALTTGVSYNNKGNFLSGYIWPVLSCCLLCASRGINIVANEVKQMHLQNVNK